jgi:hypothetical protein
MCRIEQELRAKAPPVLTVFDREKGIGAIPEDLRRYLNGSAKSSPPRKR